MCPLHLPLPACRLCLAGQGASVNLAVRVWGAKPPSVCAMGSVGCGWMASALIRIAASSMSALCAGTSRIMQLCAPSSSRLGTEGSYTARAFLRQGHSLCWVFNGLRVEVPLRLQLRNTVCILLTMPTLASGFW